MDRAAPSHPAAAEPSESDQELRRFFQRNLLAWGRTNRRMFPWREERDAFRVLVAEILLQRSRAKTVAAVYEELFQRWPSAARLATAPITEIENVVRPLGLIRRARRIKILAHAVMDRGGVPDNSIELERLPGVGRYAARAALAATLGRAEPTVDTVSARVFRRFFGLSGDADASVDAGLWRIVEEVVPRHRASELNWSVLDLAASVCMPKVPQCSRCPLHARCRWASAHG